MPREHRRADSGDTGCPPGLGEARKLLRPRRTGASDPCGRAWIQCASRIRLFANRRLAARRSWPKADELALVPAPDERCCRVSWAARARREQTNTHADKDEEDDAPEGSPASASAVAPNATRARLPRTSKAAVCDRLIRCRSRSGADRCWDSRSPWRGRCTLPERQEGGSPHSVWTLAREGRVWNTAANVAE